MFNNKYVQNVVSVQNKQKKFCLFEPEEMITQHIFCFPTQSPVITGLSEQSGKLILAFDDGFINVIDDFAHQIRLNKSSFFICQALSPLKFERSNENILHGFGFIILIFFIYVILSLIIIATKKKQSKQTSKKAIRKES
ncbi:hypothetical protein BLOT_008171 [Blomia tropicalis]|nr:hypothetical protein BLOT_008171 [Blomia tropicalis]